MSDMKRCTKCGNEYPATTEYFYANKHNASGLRARCRLCCCQQDRQRYLENSDQRKVSRERWTQNNIEKVREKNRRWKEEHKEQERERRRVWQQTHPEQAKNHRLRYQQLHGERLRQRYRNYKQANPEKGRAHNRNRRARLRDIGGKHTATDILVQLEHQKHRCYYCSCKLDKYHVDHVIPLSRGGSNDPSNLVIACPACNLSKHNKLLHEWEGSNGRLL